MSVRVVRLGSPRVPGEGTTPTRRAFVRGRSGGPWAVVAIPLLAALLLPGSRVAAQTDVPAPAGSSAGGWTLTLGLARQGITDRILSPMRHRGTGVLVGGGYDAWGGELGWRIGGSYTGPTMTSSLRSEEGGFEDTHLGEVGYLLHRRIASPLGGRVGVWAGAALDVRVSVREHHYDDGNVLLATERVGDVFAPLQASAMWTLSLGGGTLAHRFALPLLSLVVRTPPTGLEYRSHPDLAGPARLTGFDSELTFRMDVLGGRLDVFHRLTLLEYPDPRPVTWVLHLVGVRAGLGR